MMIGLLLRGSIWKANFFFFKLVSLTAGSCKDEGTLTCELFLLGQVTIIISANKIIGSTQKTCHKPKCLYLMNSIQHIIFREYETLNSFHLVFLCK